MDDLERSWNFIQRYNDKGEVEYEIEGEGGYMDSGDNEQYGSGVWLSFNDVSEVDEFCEFVKKELRRSKAETREMLIAQIAQLSDLIWKKNTGKIEIFLTDRFIPLGFFGAYRCSLIMRSCYAPVEFIHPFTESTEQLDKQRITEMRDFLVRRLKCGIPMTFTVGKE